MQDEKDMQDIKESRKKINQIDEQMAALFQKRMAVCKDIALYKKESGLSVRDEVREAEVVKRNVEKIENVELQPYYADFIKGVMDVSCKYQSALMRKMKVAYSGTAGAFAYIAAKECFPKPNILRFRTSTKRTNRLKGAISIVRCSPLKTVMPAKSVK